MGKRPSLVAICLITLPGACSGQSSRVDEVVANCGANYDKLQSWIIETTQLIESSATSFEKAQYTHAYDIRFDGRRASVRWYEWGDVGGVPQPVPQEKAIYRSMSWYGDMYVNYGKDPDANDAGSCVLDRHPAEREVKILQYANPCSCFTGFCPLGTYDRIDTVLRRADTISIRQETEVVGEVNCHVVDAATRNGNYTVWIDPQHGYSIAQIHL